MWKLSQDGKTASRTLENGAFESRLISAITPEELATALPADPPTPEEQLKAIEQDIESHIEETAKFGGFYGTSRAIALAAYANPWQAKAIALRDYHTACWTASDVAKADIIAGKRAIPTKEEVILELPSMVWPV